MSAETTYGIDLGTTQSCVAWVDTAGTPVVIRNSLGEDTTPSVVYFDGPERVTVGTSAKNSAILAPHLVAELTKRLIGNEDSAGIYHGRNYSPEEIAALVLRELARSVHEKTGGTVRDVVITVPAYFGVAEREATRRAGHLAGLTVLDVLDEPIAAALHYQALDTGDGVRHLLICDLGGGTYDTTVIRLEGDDVRVLCTDGARRLGGADWDDRIQAHLLASFTAQHPKLDPRRDEPFMQELANISEQVKKDLSKRQACQVNLRFSGAVARIELTRATLEKITDDLLEQVVEITARTVALARRKDATQFDDVVLVGGMSKMPAVAERIEQRLGLSGRHHEPELAVAKGAALHAVLRQFERGTTGQDENRLAMDPARARSLAAKRVSTVIPRAFGVMAVDARDPLALTEPLRARRMVAHLLYSNTPLPADTGPFPFATAVDNQRMVEIEVWEQTSHQESDELSDNVRIGRGLLRNLPPRKAGAPFNVIFLMSETGKLTVRAEEAESGALVEFELQIGNMSPTDVATARADIARHDISS